MVRTHSDWQGIGGDLVLVMMVKLTEEIPHACTLRFVYTVYVNIRMSSCIASKVLYTAHDQISACLSVKPWCLQWLISCIDDVISLLLKLINTCVRCGL